MNPIWLGGLGSALPLLPMSPSGCPRSRQTPAPAAATYPRAVLRKLDPLPPALFLSLWHRTPVVDLPNQQTGQMSIRCGWFQFCSPACLPRLPRICPLVALSLVLARLVEGQCQEGGYKGGPG